MSGRCHAAGGCWVPNEVWPGIILSHWGRRYEQTSSTRRRQTEQLQTNDDYFSCLWRLKLILLAFVSFSSDMKFSEAASSLSQTKFSCRDAEHVSGTAYGPDNYSAPHTDDWQKEDWRAIHSSPAQHPCYDPDKVCDKCCAVQPWVCVCDNSYLHGNRCRAVVPMPRLIVSFTRSKRA